MKLLFIITIIQITVCNAQFKILSDNSPYMKGHVYMRAFEGDGSSGIAYLQARDMSGTSSISLQLRTQNSGSVVNAMRITSAGNIGMGTTSPSNDQGWGNALDVRGSSHAKILATASNASYKTGIFTHTTWHDGGGFVGTESAHDLHIITDYTPRIEISGSNGHVGINGYVSSTFWLYVTGDCRADSWLTYSDSSAKRDIKDIEVSEKIKDLRPVQFKWKEDKYPLRKPDTLYKKVIDNRINYGFIAQDVKKIFPDIVTEEENGELNLNYDAFIPMLVDCYKKMDNRIETLEQIITEQEIEIIELKENNGTIKSASNSAGLQNTSSYLSQNTPNPFKENTVINYYISNEISNAVIYVFNLSGSLLKTYPVDEKGEGNITIRGSELKAGMYIYTLVANGNEIDTKRMILTE